MTQWGSSSFSLFTFPLFLLSSAFSRRPSIGVSWILSNSYNLLQNFCSTRFVVFICWRKFTVRNDSLVVTESDSVKQWLYCFPLLLAEFVFSCHSHFFLIFSFVGPLPGFRSWVLPVILLMLKIFPLIISKISVVHFWVFCQCRAKTGSFSTQSFVCSLD